ncbi:MAG: NlpC/P60 family protein, partial [Myxococcota bacterium]
MSSRPLCLAARIAYVALLVACGSSEAPASVRPATAEAEGGDQSCAEQVPAPAPLPGVVDGQRSLAYWLERTPSPDEAVLSADAARAHNASLVARGLRPAPLSRPLSRDELIEDLQERWSYLQERFADGRYVEASGEPVDGALVAPAVLSELAEPAPELFVARGDVPFHCAPRAEPFYTPSRDEAFDRNRCFTARAGEAIEVLVSVGSMRLARTEYGIGFLTRGQSLGEPVPGEYEADVRAGIRGRVGDALAFSTAAGWLRVRDYSLHDEGEAAVRSVTRADVLREAFAFLDQPYGWGGRAGGRDCSRFLMDVFGALGVELPRNSAVQAQAGTHVMDVSDASAEAKLLLFDAAHAQGVVLLHFPGHIMLYLGKAEGRPFAIHAFSEFVTPCDQEGQGEGETLHRVDRIDVSDLSLGAGSSRRDFLTRITHVSVLGMAAGALDGAALTRAPVPPEIPAECEDGLDASIFRSPQRPNAAEAMRVMATVTHDPGPMTLAVYNDEGERVELDEVRALGGPPYSRWATMRLPRGRYTAVLGDGPHVVACERFVVARAPPPVSARYEPAPAWESVWSWERDTENLYSLFIEQLFSGDEPSTWPDLQTLLRDPARNVLHDHRHLGEDASLELVPDCADLPYFLRAYFAWKLRLPFAWRQCRRGRDGRPPVCDQRPATHRTVVDAPNDLEAFRQLVRTVRMNVHSSTDRTRPDDDASDVYPVPLERYALRPGAIFADPFGHILVTTGWRAGSLGSRGAPGEAGALLAADAQPDGTVGRRRFWRGSFLFTPDTSAAGAGFKNWRPVVYERVDEVVRVLTNRELDGDEHVRF